VFARDDKLLVSGGIKGVSLWDVESGKLKQSLPTGDSAALALALAPDGRTLASGSFDSFVRTWDTQTWEVQSTLKGSRSEVRSLAFSSDGKSIASQAGGRKEVLLWDGKLKKELKCEQEVFAVAFAPGGRTLACGVGQQEDAAKGGVEFWDVETGERLHAVGGHDGPVVALAFSPDGKMLASGSQDETVKLWNVAELLKK
jgi:WD40 repeat protein